MFDTYNKYVADFTSPVLEIVGNFLVEPEIHKKYEEAKLLDAIEKIEKSRFLPSERDKKAGVLKYAVGEWFSQRIRDKYQELSPEIFRLKRSVDVKPQWITKTGYKGGEEKNEFGNIHLQIPVFASAHLGKESFWEGTFDLKRGDYEYKVKLSSKMPIVPPEVRQARKEALNLAYRTYADALDNSLLSEIIFENPEYAPDPSSSELLVLWKPKPSEIHAKIEKIDRDPALVLRYGKPYLVATWDEPNEEPFMNIINACKLPGLDNFIEKSK